MFPLVFFLNLNGSCQLIIDTISAILDGNHTGASAPGDHGDGLSAVAAQRKQECIQFFILCDNISNGVLLAKLRFPKCHRYYPFQLAIANFFI